MGHFTIRGKNFDRAREAVHCRSVNRCPAYATPGVRRQNFKHYAGPYLTILARFPGLHQLLLSNSSIARGRPYTAARLMGA